MKTKRVLREDTGGEKEPRAKKGSIKKWLLYITGFFSGMSVMAIELGAQRLMSPYFSSSQIVWTIIIGTIMISMAVGNMLGGRIADKYQKPDLMFTLLLSAAVWVGLVPLFGKFVMSGIAIGLALAAPKGYLIWAAFLSCIVVFVYPLLILGMVTPNLVRYACSDLSNSGKTVGKIEALNTIGSILGTFLPTFVTIPTVGTSVTFVIFAAILFIICLVYFFMHKLRRAVATVLACVTLAAGGASSAIGIAYWNSNILYEGESVYNYLRVEDEEDKRILSTNVLFGVQSVKTKTPGLAYTYHDYALVAPVVVGADKPKDILSLGLGAGTFATQCEYYFENNDIDGVEIDGDIIRLAREYFDLPDSVKTYEQDGRAFINATEKTYDIIMIDAYQDISIPFQMATVEFFALVKEHLNEGGMIEVNLNMHSEGEGNINDWISSTIKNVFDYVYTAKFGTNVMLYAADYDVKEALKENLDAVSDNDLRALLAKVCNGMESYDKTEYVFTDDKASVELRSMRVLDEMIRSEIAYFKDSIKGKSLKELLEMLFSGGF